MNDLKEVRIEEKSDTAGRNVKMRWEKTLRVCACVFGMSMRNVPGPDFGMREYRETVFPSLGPVYSP